MNVSVLAFVLGLGAFITFNEATEALFPLDVARLRSCMEGTLRRLGGSVAAAPGKEETLFTAFRKISISELQEISELPEPREQWSEGQYRLMISIAPEDANQSRVAIRAIILAKESPTFRKGPPAMGPARPIDWKPLNSNGHLEARWYQVFRAHCSP